MLPSCTFSTPRLQVAGTGRAVTLRLTVCAMALSAAFAAPANANPLGAAVMAGQASIITQGNQTTVTNSNGAVINWQSFSIGRGEITRFVQPSASSSVLNRVVGNDPSSILGQLQSNGRVFLINPAGILVGAGARIDVGGFVASSLNLRTEDFLANRLNFQATPGAGLVRNEGSITTPQGGQVFMVAPRVENAGSINAPGGEVVLAAGRAVQIGDTASPGVRIEVTGGESAKNLGSVAAEAGRIGLFGALVRNSGTLNASSAVAEGGRILLKSTGSTVIDGDASLVASGTRGGRIEILGMEVAVADRATVDASGRTAGGTVLVGGDYQGKNPEVQNAQVTWVGPQTAIRADATGAGDGGKVVVWSDDTTRAYGSISARGGAVSGNGGLIETSGKRYLDVEGIRVNASSANGQAGTWLLDPEELRIVENGSPGTDTNLTASPNFAPAVTTAVATLSADTLRNAINTNSNVTVATAAGAGSGTGDITFDATSNPIIIAKTGNTFSSTLNINALRNVVFTGGTTSFKTTAGAGSASLSVNLNAGTANSFGGANVFTDAGATVTLDATSTAPVGVAVGNGKVWNNNGTVNLLGNSTIKLPTQTNPFPTPTAMPATFQNNGTFNNSSIASWFILSNSGLQDGKFDNFGTVNTVGGSVEAIFNNNPGATLNALGTTALSLQNAQLMRGTINIPNASGTVWISEYHGTVARFHDTVGLGSGRILVQQGGSTTPEADFQRVRASGLTLQSGTGVVTITNGSSLFGTVTNPGASLNINGGILAVAGDFIVPSGITYAGDAALAAGGNLTLTGLNLTGATNMALGAGGNVVIANSTVNATGSVSIGAGGGVIMSGSNVGSTASNGTSIGAQGFVLMNTGFLGNAAAPTTVATGAANFVNGTVSGSVMTVIANNLLLSQGSTLTASDKFRAVIAKDITLDSTSSSNAILATNEVNLALASPDSFLNLVGSASAPSHIKVNGPAGSATRVLFTNRTSGGLVVDGAPGIGPGSFGSGFRAGAASAALGKDLFVAYGGAFTDVCKVLPGLCVVRAVVNAPPGASQPPKPPPKDDAEGIGSFGDQAPGSGPGAPNQRKRPGVCKAA
jgi:filamentous hemagglutinin family protein